jgi:CDP-glucose 4,6-dehydratase
LAEWQCALENVEMNSDFWQGKRVFLTGHTGFKGGWLALWLQSMGAIVYGYALKPPTEINFFTEADVAKGMTSSTIADIRDLDKLRNAMQTARPDIVFHLAAQPLVRYSYDQPIETYEVNVMGTVKLLEAVRTTPSVKAVVNVTTDKCYENREWLWGYREDEAMGGFDPYSSSKGCAELISAAYRNSFLSSTGIALATARAGNVIGGGDWAKDRLIPDFLRAMDDGIALNIRSPQSTRPWQHVLEPISGYLHLAENLFTYGKEFAEGWNFGPNDEDAQSVSWIIEKLAKMCPGLKWKYDEADYPHEANYLKLDSSKAKIHLKWQSLWRLQTALEKTVDWHQSWKSKDDMRQKSLNQINDYQQFLAINNVKI